MLSGVACVAVRGACLGALLFPGGLGSVCACRSMCLPLIVSLSVSFCVHGSGFVSAVGDGVSLFLCGTELVCVLYA